MTNRQGIAFVVALDDASATLEKVGGKGASLARMAAAGLPVPPGFHITTAAYRRFITENGLQEQILSAVSTVTADQPATLEEASRKIGSLFAQSAMPDEIAGEIGAPERRSRRRCRWRFWSARASTSSGTSRGSAIRSISVTTSRE